MKKRIFAGIIAITMAASAIPNVLAEDETTTQTAEQIHELYDKIEASNECETAVDGTTLSTDTSWDGTKYLKTGDSRAVIAEIPANTDEEYMWEADVRFDESMSGIAIASKSADLAGNSNYGVRIIRNDTRNGVLWRWKDTRQQAQTGITVGENAWNSWYHIQIIGRHGLNGSWVQQLVKVTKWDGSKWVWVGEETVGVASNSKVARIVADAHTSIDNAKIVKLGADTLTVSTSPAGVKELSAGSSTQMLFKATRNNRDIAAPDVTWKVFVKDGAEIINGDVSIDANGTLTASKECTAKTVTVKAVSKVNDNDLIGEYDIKINEVDWEHKKYDNLSLNADDEVRAGGKLALTVTAQLEGQDVTDDLEDGDVTWKIYNETYDREIGNKNIKVENGELVVDKKVISQKITLLAQDADGAVKSDPLLITIKAADAVDIGDTGAGDKILSADAGEDASSNALASPSWDGSHFYSVTAKSDMGITASTTEDIIIEADIRFKEDGSGFKIRDNGSTKESGAITRNGEKMQCVSSSTTTYFTGADADAWYHVEIMTRTGVSSTSDYAKIFIYKYDENGNRVNPTDASSKDPFTGSFNMRTMTTSKKAYHHIEVQPGTDIDNIRIMQIVPDALSLTLSSDEVFAGGKVQASYKVLRQDVEIPNYPSDKLTWAVFNEDNTAVVDSGLVSVDADGNVSVNAIASAQTVNVRIISAADTSIFSSKPLAIKASDIFEVTGFGINEDGDAISELRVNKQFFYSGDVVFIAAMYDTDGKLISVGVRTYRDNTLTVGENKITLSSEIPIPDEFGSVKAMVWTALD